jgi:hypothetical protein
MQEIDERMRSVDAQLDEVISDTNPFILIVFGIIMGPKKLQRIGYPDGLYPKPKPESIKKVYQLP